MKKLSEIFNSKRVKSSIKPFIFLIFSSIIIVTFFEINRLNMELIIKQAVINNITGQYYSLSSEHAELKSNHSLLNLNYNSLEKNNSELSKNYNSLLIDYNSFENTLSELEANYSDFESTIHSQLSYFQLNSNIENITEYSNVRTQLEDCFYLDSLNTYKINLACINFILSHESNGNNLIYKNDTRNELLNLSEFYSNNGGDCDDWARTFMASFNYIKSRIFIMNSRESNIILESYTTNCNNPENFFLTKKKDWYITACPIIIYNYSYAYAICGAKTSDITGHCWTAFSQEEINSTLSAKEIIKKSSIIEPQSGEYIFSYAQSILQGYNHYVLITKNDLIMKTNIYNENSWKGYSDYYNEALSKKNIINNAIKNFD